VKADTLYFAAFWYTYNIGVVAIPHGSRSSGAIALSEQLAHPPLVEALCEIQFTPATAWDWTIPGRLYERLSPQFPEKNSVPTLGFTTEIAQSGQPSIMLQPSPDRVRFTRADGSALVQVAPQLLAINHLLPYPGWNTFSGLIRDVFAAFAAVAPATGVARIGLRYINRIAIEHGSLEEIRAIITYSPPVHEDSGTRFSSFYQRYEFATDDPVGTLIHQTAKQAQPDAQVYLVLDLDFQSTQGVSAILSDTSATRAWLDAAHERIEQAFRESLTAERFDKMRGG
jgi:uncharacterized protein (TIGR04255 family)